MSQEELTTTAVSTGSRQAVSTPAALCIIVIPRLENGQTNGRSYVQAAHHLGYTQLQECHVARLYFLQGSLTEDDAIRLAAELLADPVTEEWSIVNGQLSTANEPFTIHNSQFTIHNFIDATLDPGVTDPPAENLVKAAHLLGVSGLERAATGRRFFLMGDIDAAILTQIAAEIFANPVVQRFTLNKAIEPPFFPYQGIDDTVDIISLRNADSETLLAISKERRLALDLAEMQAVQAYFRLEAREPTDVELEMIAQTWSEHCVHKTFRAKIDYTGPDGKTETIDGILKTYLRAATEKINKPWVYSAFVDNAGIVRFDDTYDLAFKAETHNHPSALDPFGGANTGVGGVVRDILGVSARPIANTDVLCFGPPDLDHADLPTNVLHPARIADGVIQGIEDYGNKMGIPTVNGSIHYHPGYTANPLVYCGCLGILPHGSHATTPQEGDLIVAIGGRTGRDGLRGATFSSMEMDVQTSEIAGTAVQIGHPIMEKQVQEVVLRARDEKLYTAITDCGAGGFSSAVGEMAEKLGGKVQLQDVTLKYPGLRPWEIWLSEAQERMVLAVPPAHYARLAEICAGQDVEPIVLGTFGNNGRLELKYGEKVVGELDMKFLHDGIPQRHLVAAWKPPSVTREPSSEKPNTANGIRNTKDALLALLAHPDTRSKEDVIRVYDHEVQGGTAVKPLTGFANHGPSDATVLIPLDTQTSQFTILNSQFTIQRGAALSNGICPAYTDLDPYHMAFAAIDEAMRNVVAVGADPDQVSILDNFCWGNPQLPDRLGSLVRCAQGCYDAALAYQTPFISGKDSLNNEYTGSDGEKHAIPGTLLISALAMVPDVHKTVTMDLKQAGNFLFIVGETGAELGGSHYGLIGGEIQSQHNKAPAPKADALARYRKLYQAIQAGLVQACHDCSEGGLAVAFAEMCLAGGLGGEVQLMHAPRDPYWAYSSDDVILFSETISRFVVEVRPEDSDKFRAALAGVPHECVGVIGGEALRINGRSGEPLLSITLPEIEQAWRGHLNERGMMNAEQGMKSAPTIHHSSFITHHSPKVLILHANGTNRDRDAAVACQLAGGDPEIVHVNQLLAGERRLLDYAMLIIAGGFSYGDDLGAGVLWSVDLQHRLHEDMRLFAENGRPVLGICNGFQVLVKAGLLPGTSHSPLAARSVTLTYNASGHFECGWVTLQPNPNSPSLFTQGLSEPIYCPVAHGEGRLAVKDESVLAELQAQNLIPLTYVASGEWQVASNAPATRNPQPAAYPANPNGSIADIAALCNPAGNVMGLMPHPENHIFPWQHPRFHRGERGMSGLSLFVNGIKNA